MIISCPNCQTKYQIADTTIGSVGRKVQCAHCHQAWRAQPDLPVPKPKPTLVSSNDVSHQQADALFDAVQEAALDDTFEEEEAAMRPDSVPSEKAAKSDMDMALQRRREKDMAMRLKRLKQTLPYARVRRLLRFVSLVLLMSIIGGSIYLRTELVRVWPDLGGIYAAVGLGVNIYGLEFENVQTLRTLRDGADVMVISAKIRSVNGKSRKLAPVLVSILNADGQSLYQWTARPEAELIGPGEVIGFETQLNSAPQNAAQVQLVFANEQEKGRPERASVNAVGGK